MLRNSTTPHVRRIRRDGVLLAWAVDYSVLSLFDVRYLVYFPDPISPLMATCLPATFGGDHHRAAMRFLSSNGMSNPARLPAD